MADVLNKIAMAGVSAIASTPFGGIAYRRMRHKPIQPKEVLHFSKLMPDNTQEIHLTGHRGFSAVYPENTKEAFVAGGKAGFYALECDTHCTADGTWVVLHDGEIRTMFDGTGDVKSYSYGEMLQKKMINGANIDQHPNARICTLQEYIDVCKEYGCRPMIEVKDERTEKMASLYDMLVQNGILESCIIISFHLSVLQTLHQIDSNLEIWYLVNRITDKIIQQAKDSGNFGIAFCAQYNAPYPENIQKVHDNGLTAACWTVDTKDLLEKMMACGVKYITTNAILPD